MAPDNVANDQAPGPLRLSPPVRLAATSLAVCWMVVPALQYFATLQRTTLYLELSAPYEALAYWDLMPVYLALLAASLLYGAYLVRMAATERSTLP